MNDFMSAGFICQQAAEHVAGDRERQHGDKRQNFGNIAALWNAFLAIRRDAAAPLDESDIGHLFVLAKVARTQSGSYNGDDWIDMAGYAGCAGQVAAELHAEDRVEQLDAVLP